VVVSVSSDLKILISEFAQQLQSHGVLWLKNDFSRGRCVTVLFVGEEEENDMSV
jgi:hypothetical protein